ncbi:succinate dehydrogenase assembly factor 4, mitochondrial [Astyanax mexicanus]|uniref:Succinate dehydrogenase assembly factor 4, mitochondrial n=1 Tax=Astyanax mexicanus TaxID=7994 RepID=A0A3B1JK60_ASTMX|nr:succinate dehydrogenase assembly factor 4, mitochondrial [Astyanax mexicanus]
MALFRVCSVSRCLVRNGLLAESLTVCSSSRTAGYSSGGVLKDKEPLRKAKTPQGKFDTDDKDSPAKDVLEKFPDDVNPYTKERGGPRGPEPTRYGDWERKGRCIDF